MTEDRRIRRTKRLLGEALVELALERGYDDITIMEITKRADISYATFFRRFKSKDDLMLSLLQHVIDDIATQIEAEDDPRVWMTSLFRTAQANASLYRILLNSHGSQKVQDRLETSIVAVAQPLCETLLQADAKLPIDVLAHHLSTSAFSLMRWWLQNDMPYPPEQMAQYLYNLVVEPDWGLPTG